MQDLESQPSGRYDFWATCWSSWGEEVFPNYDFAAIESKYIVLYLNYLFIVIHLECDIDGKRLLQLSRNDIAILFPKEDQFVLAMDLFKYIETLPAVFPRGASVPKQRETGTSNSHQPKSSSSHCKNWGVIFTPSKSDRLSYTWLLHRSDCHT